MYPNVFEQALLLIIKPSLKRKILIFLPHVLITFFLIFLLVTINLTFAYFIAAILLIIISLVYFIKLHLTLNSTKSIYKIHKNKNDEWTLILKNKVEKSVTLLASSFISHFLIILNFIDSEGNFYTALIISDSMIKDEFRRLRVFIKINKINA